MHQRRRRGALQGVWVLLALTSCGHAGQVAPSRVAILSLDAVGLPAPAAERVRRAIAEQVERAPSLRAVPLDQVDGTARRLEGCQAPSRERWVLCATRAGGELQAAEVVVGAVGGLGNTYVLQLSLVGVKSGAVIRSLEETLFGTPGQLEKAVGGITSRLFDLARRPRWYERWWLWTLVGVGVAAAVAIPLAVRESDPYQNIPLP